MCHLDIFRISRTNIFGQPRSRFSFYFIRKSQRPKPGIFDKSITTAQLTATQRKTPSTQETKARTKELPARTLGTNFDKR